MRAAINEIDVASIMEIRETAQLATTSCIEKNQRSGGQPFLPT
jgi:hypothetical protein